jgi:hypothetical protein
MVPKRHAHNIYMYKDNHIYKYIIQNTITTIKIKHKDIHPKHFESLQFCIQVINKTSYM